MLVATVTQYQGVSVLCVWVQVFEKFTKESTSLLGELSIINESDKSSSVDKEKYACVKTQTHTYIQLQMESRTLCLYVLCRSADCVLLPSFDPETVLQTGKYHLLPFKPRSDVHAVIMCISCCE